MDPKNVQRPVDRNYEQYNQAVQSTPYFYLLYAVIPIMLFGLLCFVWALPFPHIAFLGRYNGFVNWASFLIAGLIYYYLRLSPIVSYVILFMFFAFSYLIIQLEQWQKAGGPALWAVGIVVFLIGFTAQWVLFSGAKSNNKFALMGKSATWLAVSLLKRIKFKY